MSEKEIEKKEKNEMHQGISLEDPLIYHLRKPIDYFQNHIEYLDIRKIEDLNLKDMEEIHAQYILLGGSGVVMQETNPLFLKLILSKVTGYPLEVLEKISAKDTAKLKNRIYRFFYLAE